MLSLPEAERIKDIQREALFSVDCCIPQQFADLNILGTIPVLRRAESIALTRL